MKNSLEQYKIDNHLTYEELAKRLGYTKLRVYRWCTDVCEPRKSERGVIEDKTCGAVKFSGFSSDNPNQPPQNHIPTKAVSGHPEQSPEFLHPHTQETPL